MRTFDDEVLRKIYKWGCILRVLYIHAADPIIDRVLIIIIIITHRCSGYGINNIINRSGASEELINYTLV
jgi:hypothetical protein